MSETKNRFKLEPHWMAWSVGFVLYSIASEFVPIQSVVDILDRLSLVAYATGAVMAWQAGRRGSAWVLGILTILRVALGTPEVVQRSANRLWLDGSVLGVMVLMIFVSFWTSRREQSSTEPAR